MKILAFSDLHRDQDAARQLVQSSRDADVIICAGDLATRRSGATETLNILRDCLAPVVLVHGNHDDPDEIATYCEAWDSGHYLHGSSIEIGGQTFFGLGGEIPSRNSHAWNAAETEEAAAHMLKNCPTGAVLVTHTPPLGTADLQSTGYHEGSFAIRDTAQRASPKLLLCGHIHNAWGMTGQIGSTLVHNLGPTGNWFEI